MKETGYSLEKLIESAPLLNQVKKSDLKFGDVVLITTKNSIYSVSVLNNGLYSVLGGWFDRKQASPALVTINGCTWGGSAIKVDVIAACGLRLEFGNRVLTTTIQRVSILRGITSN